jgi:hypothetical protein
MPLLETIGSGSSRGLGRFGLRPIDGLTAASAAPSGLYLRNTLGYTTNGTYWLNTGNGPFQAYVINDRDGGGWVKVLQYHNGTALGGSAAVNQNGTWTTQERNLAAGKLLTADITALHQTRTTFLARVYSESGTGPHRYWRYRIGAAISGGSHFPRMSRLGLTTNEGGSGTDYTIYTANADNCADNGAIPGEGTVYSYDFGTAKTVIGSFFYSVFNGGYRGSNVFIEWSDNNSSWTTAWTGPISNNGSQCGIIRTGVNSSDPLWTWGAGTMKYVGATNVPTWGTDQDPPGYTLSQDPSSNGVYLFSRVYTDDTRGRCGHENNGWYWPSDHNYTSSAICWSFNQNTFATNLHWMGGNGNTDGVGFAYSGGEIRWGLNSTTSMAVYVK